MERLRRRRLLYLLLPAAFFVSTFTAAAAPKLSPNDWVWKITGKDGLVHYARSFQSTWFTLGGGLAGVGAGTVIFTPLQNPVSSHIASSDTWRLGSAPPGAEAAWKGRQSGFATITADGVQSPTVSGNGFGSASFKDLQTRKKTDVSDFTADKIRAGSVNGLVGRH